MGLTLLLTANADVERFSKKINYEGQQTKYTHTRCWEWTGTLHWTGYGYFRTCGKMTLAHRFSRKIHYSEIPDGLFVLHSCHNPACVNPAHLRVGTPQDNMDDKKSADRTPRGENHGRAKLSDDEIPRVFELRAMGLTQTQIAKTVGVGQSQVSRILRQEQRMNKA